MDPTRIYELYQNTSSWFWNCQFWLGESICWEDIQQTSEFQYPGFYDPAFYPILIAAFLILLYKYILVPHTFSYIAKSCGMKKSKLPIPNPTLENIYLSTKRAPSQNDILEYSTKIGWNERQVERWLRQRKRFDVGGKYQKFIDAEFEVFFHAVMTVYGCHTMIDKPWLYNISLCWNDWPHHNVDTDVWWFYMIGMAFYWAMMFIQVPQPGRKDKIQMIIHHSLTIILMTVSWITNFTRMGTLILLVHEGVDILLQTGKMIRYAKGNPFFTDIVYGTFIVLWLILRVGIFPFWIMKSVYYEGNSMFKQTSFVFFQALLVLLMILNLMWTFIILKVGIQKLLGEEIKDIRSDDEDTDDAQITDKKNE
ncbi:unnamed protein product [Meganyctiphanes norvegica]|uniref:TLC domain-containing protein n=1 Tax=Meganyctiphanes norvegica TaxID=48144 RepID=A0AAV2QG25_MEGNR